MRKTIFVVSILSLSAAAAWADGMKFSNGTAAGHSTTGFLCDELDLDQTRVSAGHEILTITGTPQHKFLVEINFPSIVGFEGQPNAIGVEVQIGGDGSAQVCFTSKKNGKVQIKVKNVTTGTAPAIFDCYSFRIIPVLLDQNSNPVVVSGKPTINKYKEASKPESKSEFRIPGVYMKTQAMDNEGKGVLIEEGADASISLNVEIRPVANLDKEADTQVFEALVKGLATKADNFKRKLVIKRSRHEGRFPQRTGKVKSVYRLTFQSPTLLDLPDTSFPEGEDTAFGVSGGIELLTIGREPIVIVDEKPFEFGNSPTVIGRDGDPVVVDFVTVKLMDQISTSANVKVRSEAEGKTTSCQSEVDARELIFRLRPARPAEFVQVCPSEQ